MSWADWSALSMAESIFWPVSRVSFWPMRDSIPATTSARFLSRIFVSMPLRWFTAADIFGLAGWDAGFLAAARLTDFFAVFVAAFFFAAARDGDFFAGFLEAAFFGAAFFLAFFLTAMGL